eukprot:TRINITY_DN9083_c1_g1_i1.p1 TRINITY_DN9083_c1_g1~~TRINITY_DN9083_c1_g1_i1.p1  ORF type:complete len:342 (+),score=65.83 TRINITY_DN9083_c1_g1_i1:64-1089(+)
MNNDTDQQQKPPLPLGKRDQILNVIKKIKDPELKAERSVRLHELAEVTREATDADVPLQELEDTVMEFLVADTLVASAQVAASLLTRFRSLAEMCFSPVIAELLRLLSSEDTTENELLPLLMLGNVVLDHNPSVPPAIATDVVNALQVVTQPVCVGEATLLRERISDMSVNVQSPPHDIDGSSPSEKKVDAKNDVRTYTEPEVKAFLYQRKLNWESQLKKRDRKISSLQALADDLQNQMETLKLANSTLQTLVDSHSSKNDELESQLLTAHQQYLAIETRLEESNIFLKEREHQLGAAEERAERVATENRILGNENKILVENNTELQTYVTELIDQKSNPE